MIVDIDIGDQRYCVPEVFIYRNTAIRLTSDTVVATEYDEEGGVVGRFVGTVPETVGDERAEDWLSSKYFRFGSIGDDPIPESAREKMEDGADVWMLAVLNEPAGALHVRALLAVTKNGPSQLLTGCTCRPWIGDLALLLDTGTSQVQAAQVPNAQVPEAQVPEAQVPDVQVPEAQVPDGCPAQWVAVPELDRAAETVSLVEGRSVVEALVDKSNEQHQALLEAIEKEYEQSISEKYEQPEIEPTPWTELYPTQ